VAGLDLAKDFDEAVLCVLRTNKTKFKIVVKWYSWSGVKYTKVFKEVVKIYQHWNLSAIAVDCTKEDTFADFLVDEGLNVIKCRFNNENKSNIYKNLLLDFENIKILFPNRGSENIYHLRKLKKQILELQKEWKNNLLIVNHLGNRGSHDDYPDALALADFCLKEMAIEYIPKRMKPAKKINDKIDNRMERIFAKEHFGYDKENNKKCKELFTFKNLHNILRRS